MCEFLSAVKTVNKNGEDKWFFLTHDLIQNTPRGELLRKKYGGNDLIGHTAIREYYELRSGQGENWECTDFSTPRNFPPILVEAIKRGEFRGLGIPFVLLRQPALAEYEKIEQPAWAEYEKISQSALAEYAKIRQSALAEYEKIRQSAFWDRFANPENRVMAWR